MPENPNKTFHLDEGDLIEASPVCLICQRPGRQPVGSLQSGPAVELLRCGSCGVVSASRMPRQETLTRFYQHYYQGDFYQGRKERVAVLAPRRLARHIFRGIRKHVPRGGMQILDFGGGDGSVALGLAQCFLDQGHAGKVGITVIDFDPESVIRSDSGAITVTKQSALEAILPDAYDVVLASAILEHVPGPRKTLEDLLGSVRPGGVFYARTPYIVPLRRLLQFFGVTYDFTYPAHLHDMGPSFWNTILTTLGHADRFELLVSRPSFVETPFSVSFLRALAAHTLKAPWHVMGDAWPYVGGWEVLIRRSSGA